MAVRAFQPSSADDLRIAQKQFYQLQKIDIPEYQKSKNQDVMRARLRLVGSLIADLPSSGKACQLAQALLDASKQVITSSHFTTIWEKLIGSKRTKILTEDRVKAEKPNVTYDIEPLSFPSQKSQEPLRRLYFHLFPTVSQFAPFPAEMPD